MIPLIFTIVSHRVVMHCLFCFFLPLYHPVFPELGTPNDPRSVQTELPTLPNATFTSTWFPDSHSSTKTDVHNTDSWDSETTPHSTLEQELFSTEWEYGSSASTEATQELSSTEGQYRSSASSDWQYASSTRWSSVEWQYDSSASTGATLDQQLSSSEMQHHSSPATTMVEQNSEDVSQSPLNSFPTAPTELASHSKVFTSWQSSPTHGGVSWGDQQSQDTGVPDLSTTASDSSNIVTKSLESADTTSDIPRLSLGEEALTNNTTRDRSGTFTDSDTTKTVLPVVLHASTKLSTLLSSVGLWYPTSTPNEAQGYSESLSPVTAANTVQTPSVAVTSPSRKRQQALQQATTSNKRTPPVTMVTVTGDRRLHRSHSVLPEDSSITSNTQGHHRLMDTTTNEGVVDTSEAPYQTTNESTNYPVLTSPVPKTTENTLRAETTEASDTDRSRGIPYVSFLPPPHRDMSIRDLHRVTSGATVVGSADGHVREEQSSATERLFSNMAETTEATLVVTEQESTLPPSTGMSTNSTEMPLSGISSIEPSMQNEISITEVGRRGDKITVGPFTSDSDLSYSTERLFSFESSSSGKVTTDGTVGVTSVTDMAMDTNAATESSRKSSGYSFSVLPAGQTSVTTISGQRYTEIAEKEDPTSSGQTLSPFAAMVVTSESLARLVKNSTFKSSSRTASMHVTHGTKTVLDEKRTFLPASTYQPLFTSTERDVVLIPGTVESPEGSSNTSTQHNTETKDDVYGLANATSGVFPSPTNSSTRLSTRNYMAISLV